MKVSNDVIKKGKSAHSAHNKHYVQKLFCRPLLFLSWGSALGISLIHALVVVGIPFLAYAALCAYSRTLEVDSSTLIVLRDGNMRRRGLV